MDTVSLFVPKLSGDTDPNVLVSVNGMNYVLPKGKTSEVPDFVAYEYNRALQARAFCDDNIERIMDHLKEQAVDSEKHAQDN